jgi:hypothetical protein
MTTAEKNTHYGMLNDRFEGRSKRLRELGFKYVPIPGFDAAVFVKPRAFHPGKPPHTVQASLVMCADEIVWADRIEELERLPC